MPLWAAVLPEDRADVLYHHYDGGGVKINGPSILLRKEFGNKVSISANYYVDTITSASIDVVTSASPYTEERKEKSLGVDYLRGDTMMNLGYTASDENDYTARAVSFNLSQEMFGNMTTVSMGYTRASDTVGKRGEPDFSKDVDRRHYRLGLSQVLSKDWLMDLSFETITDEGYLNNPYRSVRYLDSTIEKGYSYESEVYPHTRTSNAAALRALYYLPYRASLHGEYGIFSDSWGIRASHAQLGYTHPFKDDWLFDFKYRVYQQTHADFYSDLFPQEQAQNFLARDKELSTYSNQTLGFGVSYDLGWRAVDKASITFKYDRILFDYEDFRNLTHTTPTPGTEPLYNFSADVYQLYFSVWY